MTTVFFAQLQLAHIGLGDRAIGLAAVLMTLAQLTSAQSARLTQRVGERRFGLLLLFASCLAFIALSLTENALSSLLAVLTICVASALFAPLCSARENRLIVTDDRATALSVNALFTDGILIALDLILGRAAEAHLPPAFALSAGLCLLALALYNVSCRAAARVSQAS